LGNSEKQAELVNLQVKQPKSFATHNFMELLLTAETGNHPVQVWLIHSHKLFQSQKLILPIHSCYITKTVFDLIKICLRHTSW